MAAIAESRRTGKGQRGSLRKSCSRIFAGGLVFAFSALLLSQSAVPVKAAGHARASSSHNIQLPAAGSPVLSDQLGGLIRLDVLVSDSSARPVGGLRREDFTVLDNGQPRRILSFQAFDTFAVRPDPPVRSDSADRHTEHSGCSGIGGARGSQGLPAEEWRTPPAAGVDL